MRFLLVLAFAALACAGSITPREGVRHLRQLSEKLVQYESASMTDYETAAMSDYESEAMSDYESAAMADEDDAEIEVIMDNDDDDTVAVAPNFIISWQIRRFIRKLQKQMPCGWEQYGIPPLAPLKKAETNLHLKQGILETFDYLFRFRVDGLDDFKIQKFKLNMITSKITFDFIFHNVRASATRYETNTIIDAMRELGLSVQYEGDGTLAFGLQKFRVAGTLKYKLPVLWGSAKITSLKTQISVEKCNSEVSGFLGEGPLNRMVNQQVELFVEKSINDNQAAVSDKIENTVVPRVNKMLKGKDFWTLIDLIFSSSEGESENDPIVTKCVPPTDPWA